MRNEHKAELQLCGWFSVCRKWKQADAKKTKEAQELHKGNEFSWSALHSDESKKRAVLKNASNSKHLKTNTIGHPITGPLFSESSVKRNAEGPRRGERPQYRKKKNRTQNISESVAIIQRFDFWRGSLFAGRQWEAKETEPPETDRQRVIKTVYKKLFKNKKREKKRCAYYGSAGKGGENTLENKRNPQSITRPSRALAPKVASSTSATSARFL